MQTAWNLALPLAALTLAGAAPQPQRIEDFRQDLTATEIRAAEVTRARALAQQAYLWGLPAFLHFRQATEIKQARQQIAPGEEPFGGWVLVRNLSTPETDNALPNVDTLYGANYVDLGRQGPILLRLPAITDRYFSVAVLDAWFNNFAVLGTGHNGGNAATYLIVPPGWQGDVPAGVAEVIRSPTPMIAILQRIYVGDASEVPLVRTLQDQIRVEPMAGGPFPKLATPEFDTAAPVRQTRDPLVYFDIVNRYTRWNRPSDQYAAVVASLADAGLGPGAALPADPAMRAALDAGARDAQASINAAITLGPFRNGWRVPDMRGAIPGPYILPQAVLQITQIGSLPADEAVYYVGRRDGAGALLDGRSRYTLTFAAGQLPPVDPRGFWSITMYRASDSLLVANPINRYVIRPTTPGLVRNADGSLTVHFSHLRPEGVPAGNWLPAPEGGFVVAIRAYLPKADIAEGRWFPPAVNRTP
jgi:hypothetical protein